VNRGLLAGLIAGMFSASLNAETCLSPYIKQKTGPEKVMYLWTLPAGAGSDYLSVIDVNLASATYGKILKRVESARPATKAHHMGFTDDRGRIWRPRSTPAASSSSTSGRSAEPAARAHHRERAEADRPHRPHTPYAIPGRMLVTNGFGPRGHRPGWCCRVHQRGRVRGEPPDAQPRLRDRGEAGVQPHAGVELVPQKMFMSPMSQWDPKQFSNSVTVWDLKARKIVQELKGRPGAARDALGTEAQRQLRLQHQSRRQLDLDVSPRQRMVFFSYEKAPTLAPAACRGTCASRPTNRICT